MNRISRRNWLNTDIGLKSSGGMFDLIDNMIKTIYRINDDEYCNLCGVITDDELILLLTENPTFIEKRKMIQILNIYAVYGREV